MKVRLQRQLRYHLAQTYIPSVVFVTLSWLALFISPDSIEGMYTHIHTQTIRFSCINTENLLKPYRSILQDFKY